MKPGRLRIAMMLESSGHGGAEVVVFQLAEELRRRGHQVIPVGPAARPGWLADQFRENGFEWEGFVLNRTLDAGLVGRMADLFRRRQIDVVHSHEFSMAVYGAAGARLARVPHIITMHGNQKMTAALRRRVAVRWAFRISSAAVAVSQDTKRTLDQDLGLPEDAVTVVPNGVPVRPGDPAGIRAELQLRDDEVLLLAVGNLITRKGHIVLLRALAQLEDEGIAVPWRLAIAGGRGGEEQEALEQFIAERNWKRRAHLLLHRNDIPDLQAAADIFVMPSLWEGLPLAILEAMHAGNPVIASATSGIPEAITSGVEGLLVPPGEAAPLAQALRVVLENPVERRRLGANALARAQREFTIGAMTDAYERLYFAGLDE
ncbi:MAG TPA: glycosyltransferase family 4 protein [Gemmatimonadales bacterium]|nr:glycosyltransferase family 4 protein [Gemmatimonadales bacterium]